MVNNKQDRPALHALYVLWGTQHLLLIDKAIARFNKTGSLNMLELNQVLIAEREKLVAEKEAYKDADEINRGLKVGKWKHKENRREYKRLRNVREAVIEA